MIRSMTAYARSSFSDSDFSIDLELKSYNSRNLDIVVRLPSAFFPLEEKIRSLMASSLTRGRLEARFHIKDNRESSELFELDLKKALSCKRSLEILKSELSLKGEVDLPLLMSSASGILKNIESLSDSDTLLPFFEIVVKDAFKLLNAMRLTEGNYLAKDFYKRLSWIEKELDYIEEAAEELVFLYQKRLKERVALLTRELDMEVDQGRLLQEIAFFAERSDISEELVRSRAHIAHFIEIMEGLEPGGRKLNFLLQEFNREFNTIGSKVGDSSVAHRVVALKAELEKIREQVQNIE